MAVFNKNKFSKFLYMPHLVTQYSTEDWVVEQAQLFEVFLFGMFGVPEAEFSDKL